MIASNRMVSRPKHDKILRLKCFSEVYRRLIAGQSVVRVAEWVQKFAGEYTDVSRQSLERELYRYRQSIPAAAFAMGLPPGQVSPAITQKIEQVKSGLDELAELEKLYQLQVARLGIDHKSELAIGKLLPGMALEVRETRSILESIARLKQELGLTERAPDKLEVGIGIAGILGVQIDAQVAHNAISRSRSLGIERVLSDPNSRKKVLTTLARLSQEIRRKNLVQEDSPDAQDALPAPASPDLDLGDLDLEDELVIEGEQVMQVEPGSHPSRHDVSPHPDSVPETCLRQTAPAPGKPNSAMYEQPPTLDEEEAAFASHSALNSPPSGKQQFNNKQPGSTTSLSGLIARGRQLLRVPRSALEPVSSAQEEAPVATKPDPDYCLPGSCPHEGKVECPQGQEGLPCEGKKESGTPTKLEDITGK